MVLFFPYLLAALIAYLIASFSPGIIVSQRLGNIDIREHGSKSTGTTNVLRVMGAKAGLLVMVLDIGKTLLACYIGQRILSANTGGDPHATLYGGLIGGLFAVIGHNWPVYHKFYGGKGIACSITAIVYLFPQWGLIALAIGILTVVITRYVSLGSMLFLVVSAILISIEYLSTSIWCPLWTLLLAALGIYRHRSNIQRLRAGTENKFGSKAKKP